MKVEPLFKKGDYIINNSSGDIAVIKGVTKKNYYQFSHYYDAMFDTMKDLKDFTYELQVNYQKFFEICNDAEKKKLDEIIKKQCG